MGPGAVAGASVHNGWAIVVVVGSGASSPLVIERRRVELADPDLPNQPHHHEAAEMGFADASALIGRVTAKAKQLASEALEDLRSSISPAWNLTSVVISGGPDVDLPDELSDVLDSRRYRDVADGAMYRSCLIEAATDLGMDGIVQPRRSEINAAASRLRMDRASLESMLTGLRKELGPPWQKDHRLAAACALAHIDHGR